MSAMTDAMTRTAADVPHERSLLIVEDDKSFLLRLARAMEGRGFVVTTAESVADGLLQVEKADISFRTMMEVRNKLLEAYREVMRMQI